MTGTGWERALFGPSETGQVMSEFDWSATSVGDPEGWPLLLQTLVRLMLSSRFPMWLGWGPELAFFYNDAYARGTLGVKHPWALARPASQVWSEIWTDLSPRVGAVVDSGQATWDEALLLFLERSGYREETYHTFSYSPVSDLDGRIVGLLCVVSEETSRVIAERRMETIRDLASRVSAARTQEAVFEAVRHCLSRNSKDLPFTLTYVLEGRGVARLAGATGIQAGHRAAPEVVALDDAGAAWPLAEVLAGGGPRVVDNLAGRFADLPTGAWDERPAQAVLMPLSEGGMASPSGVFVAGLNPYRLLDAGYMGFAGLVAGGIAAGLASAGAYEAERRRAESLAELDRAKTEFFSNVSHEFRTPLTLISAPTEDALSDDLHPLPGIQRERLELIQRNTRRLRRLVNDMLDFARIEGGRLLAETVATDLTGFTRDVAMSFAPAIERAGLEFTLDLEPLGRDVQVDRDMWEKIVLNLLSNALKFTLAGAVRLSLRGDGQDAVLSVTDTGVGIDSEHLPHLFERFYRAPRSAARSHEGTGIGLALVAELARLHGGDVSAESTEGQGSTFRVRIPYGQQSAGSGAMQRESSLLAYLDEALQWLHPNEGSSPATSEVRSVAGRTAAATVLIVDDNPDMRSYLRRVLEPYWQVEVASDGAEALTMIHTRRPDLVLSDVMMPRVDGFSLLGTLRSDPATATIPVVLLSARAGEEAAVEGLEAGADDYLVKPFSGLELLARVRSNLELASLRNRDAEWRAALVDSLQDAVVVLDAAGRLIEANSAFERLLGYPRPGPPYVHPYPWVIPPDVDADAHRAATDAHRRALAGERLSVVLPVRHRLGHRLYVSVRASSVGDGEDRRSVVAFHDVTAELAGSERDAALARLGIRMAEAGDVSEVRDVGLTELLRAFGARRASILTWQDGAVAEEAARGAGPATDPLTGSRVLALAGRANPVVLHPPDGADPGLVQGMGALLDPREDRRLVWLDLGDPRRLGGEEASLLAVLCGYFGQALHRAQLFDDSREVATAMQRAILGPTDVPDGMAVRYLPGVRPLEVGGDWYDVVDLPGGCTAVVVGDCTGRGLAAATTMGQLRSACRALLLQEKRPADVVAALDMFAERLPGAVCTTVFCAVMDDANDTLLYASAGHLPALLMDPGGEVTVLDQGQGVPLGLSTCSVRPETEVNMGPGATLVLYTDGLVERRGESLDEGIDRLRRVLVEHRGAAPDQLADELVAALVPPGSQSDDIALLVHRRPHARLDGRPDFSVTLRTDPDELSAVRRRLRDWLAGEQVAGADATDLLIAVGEACANSIEHAYGFSPDRSVVIEGNLRRGMVEMTVADRGRWKSGQGDGNRGRGVGIMRALMDQVDIEHGAQGTVVRMRKRVRP